MTPAGVAARGGSRTLDSSSSSTAGAGHLKIAVALALAGVGAAALAWLGSGPAQGEAATLDEPPSSGDAGPAAPRSSDRGEGVAEPGERHAAESTPPLGPLVVEVRDRDGAPLAGAAVDAGLDREDGSVHHAFARRATDENGLCAFDPSEVPDAAGRAWRVSAWKSGAGLLPVARVPAGTESVTLRVLRPGRLLGRIAWSDGAPPPRAGSIRLHWDIAGVEHTSTVLVRDGAFEEASVAGVLRSLSFLPHPAAGEEGAAGRPRVPSDAECEVAVPSLESVSAEFVLDPPADLRARFVDARRRGIPGVGIAGADEIRVVSDSDGLLVLPRALRRGRETAYEFHREGYERAARTVLAPKDARTVEIEIALEPDR